MQSRISQYFQTKKGNSDPTVVRSTVPVTPKASVPLEGKSSVSKKRVREDLPVITIDDDEDETNREPEPVQKEALSSKKRIEDIMQNQNHAAGSSSNFQNVVFYNERKDEDDWQHHENTELPDLPTSKKINFTPLETQIVNIRRQYPDCLLMVECGYRMRFFGQDAVTAAKLLGIYAHQSHNFMVASVPTYRASFHCQRLLTAGLKVRHSPKSLNPLLYSFC
jgi:hypothetical protein